jgi:hypothetical protein
MSDQVGANLGSRRTTLWLLGATVVLAAAALLVGISDNPPGILLLYLAGLTLVLSVTLGWRNPKWYGRLFLGSVLGFFVLAAIHNFAEVGAHRITHLPLISLILSSISVVGFIAGVIVCPMACLVGAVGWMAGLKRSPLQGD